MEVKYRKKVEDQFVNMWSSYGGDLNASIVYKLSFTISV